MCNSMGMLSTLITPFIPVSTGLLCWVNCTSRHFLFLFIWAYLEMWLLILQFKVPDIPNSQGVSLKWSFLSNFLIIPLLILLMNIPKISSTFRMSSLLRTKWAYIYMTNGSRMTGPLEAFISCMAYWVCFMNSVSWGVYRMRSAISSIWARQLITDASAKLLLPSTSGTGSLKG